jgi:uncharacterized membrane protein
MTRPMFPRYAGGAAALLVAATALARTGDGNHAAPVPSSHGGGFGSGGSLGGIIAIVIIVLVVRYILRRAGGGKSSDPTSNARSDAAKATFSALASGLGAAGLARIAAGDSGLGLSSGSGGVRSIRDSNWRVFCNARK